MILHAFALKNRLSGIYERPFCEPYDVKEYADVLAQSLALASVEELRRHREFDVYCVGTFDSKEGFFVPFQEFVMSLESLCNSYIAYKENQDVREEKKDDIRAA